jgi:hypothetical protein
MPRWKAVLHADSLEWLKEDAWVEGGIFTTRFIDAPDASIARSRAINELAAEFTEQPFLRGLQGKKPNIGIEELAEVSFFAGRIGQFGYVFYDANDVDEDEAESG